MFRRLAPRTMVQLADETKATAGASFDFLGLDQSFSGLLIVWSGRCAVAAAEDNLTLRLNNDSGANYDRQRRETATATTISESQNQAGTSGLLGVITADSSTAGFAAAGEIIIPNYAGTAFHKIVRGSSFARTTDASQANDIASIGFIWKDTSAINRITLLPSAGNWMTGSRCTVYGMP